MLPMGGGSNERTKCKLAAYLKFGSYGARRFTARRILVFPMSVPVSHFVAPRLPYRKILRRVFGAGGPSPEFPILSSLRP